MRAAAAVGVSVPLITLGSCGENPPAPIHARAQGEGPPAIPPIKAPSETADALIRQSLMETGTQYSSWQRISDAARWAPTLCAPPKPVNLHWSQSQDDQTHGRKLYYLYCNQPDIYDWSDRYAEVNYRVPAGFTIVKEAHLPVALAPGAGNVPASDVVDRDGKSYRIGPTSSLFVMTKFDESTPNSDRGWIYATLDSTGNEITSMGAIESCMRCHTAAHKDRLFGFHK